MSSSLERNNEKLMKSLSAKVKQPSTLSYRQWNASEPVEDAKIEGRVSKFIFTAIVVFVNAILATMLFFLSSNMFSWLFFALVLASLVPKVPFKDKSMTTLTLLTLAFHRYMEVFATSITKMKRSVMDTTKMTFSIQTLSFVMKRKSTLPGKVGLIYA